MSYTKIFDAASAAPSEPAEVTSDVGDHVPDSGYVYDDAGEIELRVNVALATGRPLLVRGPPGCGKSSLAQAVAAGLGWSYLEHVVTSRDQARDLQWRFDAIRRLRDAQADDTNVDPQQYITPGALWWAFNPESAAWAGVRQHYQNDEDELEYGGERRGTPRAVLLIDEIDKADPDLPNDLLEAFGARKFTVTETRFEVEDENSPFLIVTTNRERHLPQAFLRRCVSLKLTVPGETRMLAIAESHYPDSDADTRQRIYDRFDELRKEAKALGVRQPGTAEYLDAVRSATELDPGDDELRERLIVAAIWKHHDAPKGTEAD